MFYLIATIVCYLGVLFSPLAHAKDVCPGYDEELVNGRCEIPVAKITLCPGTVVGDKCVTEPEATEPKQ
jgi:hypothetical protein